jgi:hypothetical protein
LLFWILLSIWIVSGWVGYWFWWTYDLDMEFFDVVIALFAGTVIGPIWWIVVGIDSLIRDYKRNRSLPYVIFKARH